MRTGFRSVFFTLLLLALAGCGKSEVDKCVDAGMRSFDAKCASKEYSDCDKPGARSEEEFSLRVGCLKAAGKN